IARDVFVPVGKFTFPADFIIVDYESDPRVPFILGRPFIWTARALIDVHGEEMILCDGDERLTLNMRHDTSSYSNQPQKESINMINIYDDSKGGNVLIKKFLDLDSTKDLHPPHNVNPLSGSTTSSSSPNHLLEEFADELALITFPPGNDDLSFGIESDPKEIEYLLKNDPIKEMDFILKDSVDEDNLADNLANTMPEMFTDEHTLDYSLPPLYDEYDDDLFEVESDTKYVYDDPFDSKGEKIKESKLLIDELDLPSDFLPSPEYDSFLIEDLSEVDALPQPTTRTRRNAKWDATSPSLGILCACLSKGKSTWEVKVRCGSDSVRRGCRTHIKKLAISHASLMLEDFDPPLYKLSFFKEVSGAKTLPSFSSEKEEKVFKPGILTSKVHFSLLLETSHQGHKVFKIIKILENPMDIFLCFCGENIRILDVPCLHFYPP
nr:reverse transcriptase domain-containing protein [Tanacetum cinerariifolium]